MQDAQGSINVEFIQCWEIHIYAQHSSILFCTFWAHCAKGKASEYSELLHVINPQYQGAVYKAFCSRQGRQRVGVWERWGCVCQ